VTPRQLKRVDRELKVFLDEMTDGMGRSERRDALRLYLLGLLMDGERKTIVPMAGRLVDDEGEIEAMRQRLQQCVTVSTWADAEIRSRVALEVERELRPEVFIIDDTGFPKKGKHSVGVARQYSGTLGRVDNCQVATSLHLATDETSCCIGMQLYLPEAWASDMERRRKAGVPEEVKFKRKWELALDLLDDALSWGLPPRLTLGDSAYGDCTEFRDGLDERGCLYLVGVGSDRLVWPPGSKPRPPKPKKGRPGRRPTRYVDGDLKPLLLADLATEFRYRKYSCPDAVGGLKSGYFAFTRLHLAEKHTKGRPPSPEVWLIAEYRPGNNEYKFYVSNLPASTPRRELVRFVKLRWRVERDYQEMKGEVGLDHFEGRTWIGFHHHVTLCAVAHAFLALQRRVFPPRDTALDAADGPSAHPADSPGRDRDLPAMPAAFRPCDSPSRPLSDVIKWY
jgi:SRSO17 transposase